MVFLTICCIFVIMEKTWSDWCQELDLYINEGKPPLILDWCVKNGLLFKDFIRGAQQESPHLASLIFQKQELYLLKLAIDKKMSWQMYKELLLKYSVDEVEQPQTAREFRLFADA